MRYLSLLIVILAPLFLARDMVWEWIGGPADQGAVAFGAVARTGQPNDWLICPQDLCANADAQAPVFAIPASALQARITEVMAARPNATAVAANRWVERTAIMAFPDTVQVDAIALGDSQSTIAAYSRSLIGYSDMGTNRARLEAIVTATASGLPPAPVPAAP